MPGAGAGEGFPGTSTTARIGIVEGDRVLGIGAREAPWLPLARTDAVRALFARIRSALDPS